MKSDKLTLARSASRKSDYKGEKDHGTCGDTWCNKQLQARIDMEAASFGTCKCGFPTARFSDNAQSFAFINFERNGSNGMNLCHFPF